MTTHEVRVLPEGVTLVAQDGADLYELLRASGLAPEAFCGGNGKCGKCTVNVNGENVLSCRTYIDRDMTVIVPRERGIDVMTGAADTGMRLDPARCGALAAFDIGTTTVVCYLISEDGKELASCGALNPQVVYGADVVSRIRSANAGTLKAQSELIRGCMTGLLSGVCDAAGILPSDIGVISVVGNPTMQQLFLGLSVENLVEIPFSPKLCKTELTPASDIFPMCGNAVLLTVPDVSGYIGADTVACAVSTGIYKSDALTLMVDIGTNGEIVLGSRERLVTCATAAGPALEGAGIRFGMRGARGAIDRVWYDGDVHCHVIGDTKPAGICGSGLIDAAAVYLDAGRLDRRGRMLPKGTQVLPLAGDLYLTQDDIRALQTAKGAICAGIEMLCARLGVTVSDIDRVLLAGAFGTHLDPVSACRIGLLPKELSGKISAVGNAAGLGAKMLACDRELFEFSNELSRQMELVELANEPGFQRSFAKCMYLE